MNNVLDWYASRAADLARYGAENPPNAVAMMAVVEELSIDAGNRAKNRNEDLKKFLDPSTAWVIIKRGLYYRPNSQGYTGILVNAGLYTDEESRALSDGVEVTRMPFSEAAEVMKATFIDIERDYWREEALSLREKLSNLIA